MREQSISVQYVVSSRHDYAGYICDDAGPVFADDYRWPVRVLGRDAKISGAAQIIDPLVCHEEQAEVLREVYASSEPYFVRVTDPGWTSFDWAIAPLVLEAVKRRNVFLMLSYTPNEQTAYYVSIAANKKYVHCPYLYREESEVAVHSARKRGIILSGKLVPDVYPLRCLFARNVRIWPPLFLRTRHLRHPGYAADARLVKHTRQGYVAALAEWEYAFVCSSRTRSELLKYRELAYAGCAPVGDLPMSLLDCPGDAFVRYVGGARAVARIVSDAEAARGTAERYRSFMRRTRGRETMIGYVNQQISSV